MPVQSADRNLLFGFLALQNNFIPREELIAAVSVWLTDKSRALSDILRDRRSLADDEHELLAALVRKHLQKHDNDPEKSLAALSSVGELRDDLKKLGDADVEASLLHVAAERNTQQKDPDATLTVDPSTVEKSRFRILRPHAEGGLGQVFVAKDEELNREVALKEIKFNRSDDAESRTRFVLEAEITGGLEHPGIVPVYGLGQYADGRPFYAMRFIRGDSLKEAIARFFSKFKAHQPPPQDLPAAQSAVRNPQSAIESAHSALEPLRVQRSAFDSVEFRKLLGRFIDVCNAIEYAHSRGVLHRDLKPGNIMLGKYGETLVVDWGLAKAKERGEQYQQSDEYSLQPRSTSGSAATEMGRAIGTPTYMSPEQASGRLDQLGPASDVYSLGATLYSVLTGQVPFAIPNSGEILRRVQTGDFLPPRQLCPTVPQPLEAICLKAMALKPSDRYSSPQALADDLERYLADEPVSVILENLIARGTRWLRKHRGVAATAALALFILAGVSIISALTINEQRKLATAAAVEARSESRRAFHNYYGAQMNLAQHDWERNNIESVLNRLQRTTPEFTRSEDLRGFEWHHWNRLCHSDLLTIRHPAPYKGLEPSRVSNTIARYNHDGSQIISAGGDGTIKVWSASTGQELISFQRHGSTVASLALSSDGRLIASEDYREIKIWDSRSGKEIFVKAHGDHGGSGLAFRNDGTQIVSAGPEKGTVAIWDISTGRIVKTLQGHANGNRSLALSVDGAIIAIGGEDGSLGLWNTETGDKLLTLEGHTAHVAEVDFSPDGSQLASVGADEMLRIWDATTGKKTAAMRAHLYSVYCVDFNADGTELVTGGGDGTVTVWNARTWNKIRTFKGHTARVNAVSYHSSGRRIVSSSDDDTIKVWDESIDQGAVTFPLPTASPKCVAFHPTGSFLAVGTDIGEIHTLTPSTRKGRPIEGHKASISCVAFNRDGSALASGSEDGMLKVWVTSSWNSRPLAGHAGRVTEVRFSRDTERLTSTCVDGTVRVWNVSTGAELNRIDAHSLGCSADGALFACLAENGAIKIFETMTGRQQALLDGHQGTATCAAFSEDDQKLVAASSSSISVWDVKSGRKSLTIPAGSEPRARFHPDGKRIVSFGGTPMKIWDLTTGQELLALDRGGQLDAVFDPRGEQFASVTQRGWEVSGQLLFQNVVNLWNARPKEMPSVLMPALDDVSQPTKALPK